MSEATSRFDFRATEHEILSPTAWSRAGLYPGIKRALDVICVLCLAPLILTVVGALAVLVRLDGGRAFFTQPRIGRGGHVFTMWKLRTMVPNAEERLRLYLEENPAAKAEWNKAQKLAVDPRVTATGGFLRKYSLDELPQLFNVLRGDMSLVGPRPMCVDQLDLYPRSEYFWMRPGITGLWQVSERNRCSFAERAIYDGQYAAIMCFSTDLRIIWRTVSVVFRGTGV